jgi:hypothetical protein
MEELGLGKVGRFDVGSGGIRLHLKLAVQALGWVWFHDSLHHSSSNPQFFAKMRLTLAKVR